MINHLHFLYSGLLRQFICLNKEELDRHLAVQRTGLLTNITLSLFKVLTFRTLTCYALTNVIDSEPEVRRSKCIRKAKDKQAKLYKRVHIIHLYVMCFYCLLYIMLTTLNTQIQC